MRSGDPCSEEALVSELVSSPAPMASVQPDPGPRTRDPGQRAWMAAAVETSSTRTLVPPSGSGDVGNRRRGNLFVPLLKPSKNTDLRGFLFLFFFICCCFGSFDEIADRVLGFFGCYFNKME